MRVCQPLDNLVHGRRDFVRGMARQEFVERIRIKLTTGDFGSLGVALSRSKQIIWE